MRDVFLARGLQVASFGPLAYYGAAARWPAAWATVSMVGLPPRAARAAGLHPGRWVAAPKAPSVDACRAAGFLGPTANQGPDARACNWALKFVDRTGAAEATIAVVLARDVDARGCEVQIMVDYGGAFGRELRAAGQARARALAAATARGRFIPRKKESARRCGRCGTVYANGDNFVHTLKRCLPPAGLSFKN